ncbi:hypothetical protein E2320_008828 [Naja naja]|nr:hypothetical protein E2320_008828 [Naja naja]
MMAEESTSLYGISPKQVHYESLLGPSKQLFLQRTFLYSYR